MTDTFHFPRCFQHEEQETFSSLQYFTLSGVQKKLLDFVEPNDENTSEIADMLLNCLSTNNLHVSNVSSYSADNASVNFTALKALKTNIN